MRLFVALPVPRAAQQAIGDLIKDFAVPDSPVRWVRQEGLHLTLKFFGEVEETKVSEISTALGRTTAGMSPLAVLQAGLLNGAKLPSRNPVPAIARERSALSTADSGNAAWRARCVAALGSQRPG